MAVALRASSLATSTGAIFTTGAATLALGTAAQVGDVVVAAFATSHNRTATVTDNNSNAFTELVYAQRAANFISTGIYFRRVASGTVTSVTVTLDGTVTTDCGLSVGAWTSMAESAIAGNTATDVTTATALQTTPNVTTTVADGLLVSTITGDAARTFTTADPDYVVVTAFTGTSFYFGFDYRILSATETNNHTVTMSAAVSSAHTIGELRGAVASATPALIVIRRA